MYHIYHKKVAIDRQRAFLTWRLTAKTTKSEGSAGKESTK